MAYPDSNLVIEYTPVLVRKGLNFTDIAIVTQIAWKMNGKKTLPCLWSNESLAHEYNHTRSTVQQACRKAKALDLLIDHPGGGHRGATKRAINHAAFHALKPELDAIAAERRARYPEPWLVERDEPVAEHAENLDAIEQADDSPAAEPVAESEDDIEFLAKKKGKDHQITPDEQEFAAMLCQVSGDLSMSPASIATHLRPLLKMHTAREWLKLAIWAFDANCGNVPGLAKATKSKAGFFASMAVKLKGTYENKRGRMEDLPELESLRAEMKAEDTQRRAELENMGWPQEKVEREMADRAARRFPKLPELAAEIKRFIAEEAAKKAKENAPAPVYGQSKRLSSEELKRLRAEQEASLW